MHLTPFFGLLGGLLVLAFIANKLARKTAVPDVLVLIAAGILMGPVLHLVDPSRLQLVAHGFGTLALILILFEAGLDLDIRNTLRHFPGGIMIAVLSYGFGVVAVGLFIARFLHIQRVDAFLAASALACISSSIILPVLQQIELRPSIKSILLVEASLSDALAVLLVGILLDISSGAQAQGGTSLFANIVHKALFHRATAALAGVFVGGFVVKVLISLLVAFIAGYLWSRFLPMLSEERFWRVLTFAAVLLVYSVADAVGGSNLFAVIAFGATLANLRGENRPDFGSLSWQRPRKTDPREQLLTFHSELAFLVRSFFFVMLGLIVSFSGIGRTLAPALAILAILFAARWLAVRMSSIVLRDVQPREREIAVLLMPRGLITAVLAFEIIEAKGPQFDFLLGLVFSLILLSNLLLLVGTFRAHSLAAATAASGGQSLADQTTDPPGNFPENPEAQAPAA